MNIFVLDAELQFKADLAKGTARNWRGILGNDATVITDNGQGSFQRLEDACLIQLSPGIVVIHRPEQEQLNALASAAKSGCLFVVNVSGSPDDDSFDLQADWFYSVRTPLKNPDDPAFAKRFETFLDDLQKEGRRKPNFLLLEPTAVPEALLAYTLAVQYRLKIVNIHKLCAAAEVSYQKLQPYAKSLFDKNREVSFPDEGVPKIEKFEAVPGEPSGIRFKAMRNAIDLLREDL